MDCSEEFAVFQMAFCVCVGGKLSGGYSPPLNAFIGIWIPKLIFFIVIEAFNILNPLMKLW